MRQVVDEGDALRALGVMIDQFGAARTVSWLAEIMHDRSDACLMGAEHRKAAELMQVFRILQGAAARLRDVAGRAPLVPNTRP